MKRLSIALALFLACVALCAQFVQPFVPSIQQIGPNDFVAGIPSDEFQFFAAPGSAGAQRQSNWCWAACIQMVLNYHGLLVSQEQVVARVYGGLVDQPGGVQQILYALSGWAPSVTGGMGLIQAEPGVRTPNDITGNLAAKNPLIIGLNNPRQNIGHAYVLTALYYSVDAYNNTIPYKVVLRDPWPGNPSRIELPWQEFIQRCMMIVRVWVQ